MLSRNLAFQGKAENYDGKELQCYWGPEEGSLTQRRILKGSSGWSLELDPEDEC